MADWTEEQKLQFGNACTAKFVQLVDRVLYDMRMKTLNNKEVAGKFMEILEPVVSRDGSTQKDYEAVEPKVLAMLIEDGIIPAMALTFQSVRGGDALHNTQAEIAAASRRVTEQIGATQNKTGAVDGNEDQEDIQF